MREDRCAKLDAINAHVFWSKVNYSYGERFLNPLPPIKMVRVRNELQP